MWKTCLVIVCRNQGFGERKVGIKYLSAAARRAKSRNLQSVGCSQCWVYTGFKAILYRENGVGKPLFLLVKNFNKPGEIQE